MLLSQDSFARGGEHSPGEIHRPPSPARTRGDQVELASTPPTPPHPPQSLTRIRSALSMVPAPGPSSAEGSPSPQARVSALTHETRLSFANFVSLFQAFRYLFIYLGILFIMAVLSQFFVSQFTV